MIRSYRDLDVWQKAMDLAVDCYRLTTAFPDAERYGLTAQVRHSASSVSANIAEGRGRRSTGDFLRFLDIAYGSLMELETHLLLSGRLGLCAQAEVDDLLDLAAPGRTHDQRPENIFDPQPQLSKCTTIRGSATPDPRIPNPESRVLIPCSPSF